MHRDEPAGNGPLPARAADAEATSFEAAFARLVVVSPSGVDVYRWKDDDVPVVAEYVQFGLPHYATEEPPDWAERRVAELLPRKGALGDFLEHLPPGLRLGRLLAAIDVAAVDDFSLVEVVAAHKRMEAWSAARAAQAAAELAERDVMNPTWPGSVPGRTRGECVVGEELAVRLRVSRMTAIRMVACGRAFTGSFRPTGDALEQGLIDFPRAQAIVSTLLDLPTDVAVAAQWEVLDKAPGRTLRQVHQDLAKAVIAVDPDGADARHRAARQKRRVNHPRPLPDGMAHFSAVLPAVDAIALDMAVDAAARAAKHSGSSRTLDQLRADSLALMAHTALALGRIGPHAHGTCSCGCTASGASSCGCTTTSGASDAVGSPGEGSGAAFGLAPSVPDAQPSGSAAQPRPPDQAHPPPAQPCPPAQPRPPDQAHPPPAQPCPPAQPRPPGQAGPPAQPCPHAAATAAGLPPNPGQRSSGCCLPTIRLGTLAGGRADIRITVPLSTALPDPDAPKLSAVERDPEPVADLEGYGPIPPDVARALCAGGTWRRLVTDPTGTEVLDVGRTRYQPTAAIADHVRERDRTCVEPGCSTPARSCDLDHRHEWQNGGPTSAGNLDALCKRGHRVKSIGAFVVARATDGTYAWTTPTGHGYLRRTDGTVLTLPRVTAQSLRTAGRRAAQDGRDVDPEIVDAALALVAAGSDVSGRWSPGPHSSALPAGPGLTEPGEPPF